LILFVALLARSLWSAKRKSNKRSVKKSSFIKTTHSTSSGVLPPVNGGLFVGQIVKASQNQEVEDGSFDDMDETSYPIEDERANGIFNFTAAVEFIKSQKGKGVYISYKNKNEPTQIHTATRTVCHKEADDEVFSIDSEPFAYFDKKIILNENYQQSSYSEPVKNAVFSKNSGILSVSVLPGEAYNYDLSDYKAVIFRPFHSGTISTSSEELRNFCKRAKEQNVPIFVINAPDGITYASSKEYNELGINVLPMCSFPAIYIKLWLLASNNNLSAETVRKTVACEFLKTKNGDVTYAY
jgi:L-asparaginase/Glu-tRNA(Gln) amidotransferase subunit D